MSQRSLTQLLLLCLATFLLACSRDGSDLPDDDTEDEGNRVGGRLMGELTLRGSVGSGGALSWARLCAQDLVEGDLDALCTNTDDLGDYRMQGLFHRTGLLETAFTDAYTNDQSLFSLYHIPGDRMAGRANINPTTDLMIRAYLTATAWPDPATCFDDPDCARSFNENGPDTDRILRILDNVSVFLGPAWPWPEGGHDPVSDRYIADPELDRLDSMHDELRFVHDIDPTTGERRVQVVTHGQFGSLDQCGETLIEAPLSAFTEAQWPDDLATLSEADYEKAQTCAPLKLMEPFIVQITADPWRGDSPLISTVKVTAQTPEDPVYSIHHLNPRGQTVEHWSDTERTLTLADPGNHTITVRATVGGDEVQAGATIEVTGSAENREDATWGATGSCFAEPEQLMNLENICLEKQDGSISPPDRNSLTCQALVERSELTYGVGICSQQSQHGQPLLGICTYYGVETRLFHYRNDHPTRGAESAEQQHDRHQERCEQDDGEWQSIIF